MPHGLPADDVCQGAIGVRTFQENQRVCFTGLTDAERIPGAPVHAEAGASHGPAVGEQSV